VVESHASWMSVLKVLLRMMCGPTGQQVCLLHYQSTYCTTMLCFDSEGHYAVTEQTSEDGYIEGCHITSVLFCVFY